MGTANPLKRPLLLLVAIAAGIAAAYGAWVLIENQRQALAESAKVSSRGTIAGGFWWTEGDYTAFVGWPSQPPAYNKPVFMLLIHYPTETPSNKYSHHDNLNGSDDWEIATEATAEFKDGRRFNAKYAVSAKDPTEKFIVDGKTYTPDAGRLFLIDLTGSTASIKQFAADLPALIQNPATPIDPTPQIREALNKLREQNADVRQFLEGSSLK